MRLSELVVRIQPQVEFACSPRVDVGFLWILQLPPSEDMWLTEIAHSM